uniref:Uterine-secreted microprotein 1 n=1 Tax=Notamacropus eugenii TaxID=9315 RepID=H2CYD5_NOTEU|nr:uterine-secreted microprotein 1 [Notamacropus eugenii]
MERLIGLMLLSTFLALAHGQCYRGNFDIAMNSEDPRRMCLDTVDNKAYKLGDTWLNSQCQRCSCTPMGVRCCESHNPCA